MCVWRSIIPGITYLPAASMMRSPVMRGRAPARSAVTGSKGTISVMRFPSILMS